jgi:isoleucyl-tRNA synthetase
LSANAGWAAAQGRNLVVVISTELTDDLIRQGKARDVVRLVQDRRKEMQLGFTDRILLTLQTDDEHLRQAIQENAAYIQSETLAIELRESLAGGHEYIERDVSGALLLIAIEVVAGNR